MDHYSDIYSGRAADYHRMISAEDVDGNLRNALRDAAPLQNARVLDVGSGTGRIPLLLHGLARTVIGADLHHAMLLENARRRTDAGGRWPLVRADARNLPFAAGVADVVIAGWTLGHFCGWHPGAWEDPVDRALAEMTRVAVPGGAVIVIETLGTGVTAPAPPNDALAAFFERLETSWGFRRRIVATDYAFESPGDAAAVMGFFFGERLTERILANGWSRVPEWTGVWSS